MARERFIGYDDAILRLYCCIFNKFDKIYKMPAEYNGMKENMVLHTERNRKCEIKFYQIKLYFIK